MNLYYKSKHFRNMFNLFYFLFTDKSPKTANCPADILVHKLPCQKDIPVNWTVPKWTDDYTAEGLF